MTQIWNHWPFVLKSTMNRAVAEMRAACLKLAREDEARVARFHAAELAARDAVIRSLELERRAAPAVDWKAVRRAEAGIGNY